MLREEFENRMGNTVTPEAYEDIENLYIQAGDMDKDTFCDDYKLHGGSKILAEIWQHYKTKCNVLKIYKEEHQAAAEMLLRLHDEYGIKEAYDMAQTMIDLRGIVKYKLENGKQLTSIEREYVMSKL